MEIKRNVRIDINLDGDLYKQVRDQINLYRAVCRKVYSACAIAEMAGSKFEFDEKGSLKVVPSSKEVDQMIRSVFGGTGGKGGAFYGIRQFARSFHPSWKGIMGESIQYSVVGPKWTAKDAEKKRATHGFLVLNGARNFAQFNRIGIPIKNTEVKFGDRSLIMKWDFKIGPVEFRIAKMDASRHYKWRNIQNGAWKLGTVYINVDSDGKLFLLVSYTQPIEDRQLDSEKTMMVSFSDDPELFINCSGQKSFEGDVISVFEAINGLSSILSTAQKYEKCGVSAGNPRKVWGSKKIYSGVTKKMRKLSRRRSNYVQYRNHLWTRRITDNAQRWNCGKVVVVNCPSGEMFEHPWQWYQFRQFLEYKLGEIGSSVSFVEVEMEETKAA